GTKADNRHILVGVGRNGGVDVAVFVEMRIGQADGEEFVDEEPPEILLLLRRRLGGGVRIGLGVDGHIAKEAVENGVGHGGFRLTYVPQAYRPDGRLGIRYHALQRGLSRTVPYGTPADEIGRNRSALYRMRLEWR